MIKIKIPFVLALISVTIFSCSHHEKRETKYPDGKPLESFEVLETKDGSFVKDGEYKTWYPGEKPESEGQYKEGKKTGNWKTWYSNAQMKSDHNYKLDTLEGDYLAWYENGQKKIETQTSSGNYVGHFVSWFENGQMALDLTYNDTGKQTGTYTEWYENGQTKWKSNFNDKGNKIGIHTLWHTNGQKAGEWNYDDKGKLNGSLKYWDDKGHLFVYREFKDDIDVNLPATYKRPSGDRLDLTKDGTFKVTYLEQSFFSRGWKTVQGKFEITTPDPEAHIKLANFVNAILVKFNKDSIVYKNSFRTDIVFTKQK